MRLDASLDLAGRRLTCRRVGSHAAGERVGARGGRGAVSATSRIRGSAWSPSRAFRSRPTCRRRSCTSPCSAANEAAGTLAGLESARGVLQSKIGRELTLRRTPTLTFAYDDAVERGVRMTKLIDELAAELPEDAEQRMNDVAGVASALRSHDALLRRHAREPGRRRARLDARRDARAARARQGRRHVPRGRRAASRRVSLPRARRSDARHLPADLDERVAARRGLRERAPHRPRRHAVERRSWWSTSTITTTTPASARST